MALSVGATSEAIDAIARPIRGEAQIDEIAKLVADKRLVLLGESTHGTHEFYDVRAALTRIIQRATARVKSRVKSILGRE